MALAAGKLSRNDEGNIPLPDIAVTSISSGAGDNENGDSLEAGVRSGFPVPAAGVPHGILGSLPDIQNMPDRDMDGVFLMKSEGDTSLPGVAPTSISLCTDGEENSESLDAGVPSGFPAPIAGVPNGFLGSFPDMKSMPDRNSDGVSIMGNRSMSSSAVSWALLPRNSCTSFL